MGIRKGCYNCSKRRILCDETEPQCLKCVKKGLECSGQGLRLRFNNGVASRGKLRGLSIPMIPDKPPTDALGKSKSTARRTRWTQAAHEHPTDPAACAGLLRPWPYSTGGELGVLLNHFSTTIASGMVILDGQHNGYRNFILPLAARNPMVQKAVSSVSGFHLWRNNPELRAAAEISRAEVIQQMKDASVASNAEQVLSASTWATLLVLLIGELILGGDHYIFLLRMMCSLKDSGVREENSDLLEFLYRQTDLLTLLAQPFINSSSGIPIVDPEASFESHRQDESLSDDANQMHRQTVDIVVEATRVCFKIYSDRLQGKTASNTLTLEYLKTLVFDIQPGSAGGHSLVWQYFIAAADSDVREQRAFFTDRLIDIYNATGCANISEGLKMLEQLWARPPDQMWPQILPTISTTFVM